LSLVVAAAELSLVVAAVKLTLVVAALELYVVVVAATQVVVVVVMMTRVAAVVVAVTEVAIMAVMSLNWKILSLPHQTQCLAYIIGHDSQRSVQVSIHHSLQGIPTCFYGGQVLPCPHVL
jgi:hypothetical protein